MNFVEIAFDRLKNNESICPAYPDAPASIAVKILSGQKPADIFPALTSKEAHEYISSLNIWDVSYSAIGYLKSKIKNKIVKKCTIRSETVARWLLYLQDKDGFESLLRPRQTRDPRGNIVEYNLVSRLDEIADEDLKQGVKTSVTRAFENAAKRYGQSMIERALKDHRVLAPDPGFVSYPRCMRLLSTPADLAQEGKEMLHCVSGYQNFVQTKKSVIYSLNVNGERSTMEVDLNRRMIIQHRGEKNNYPAQVLVRLAKNFAKKNNLAYE